MSTNEAVRERADRRDTPSFGDPSDDSWERPLRLGQDVRLVLAAVGGGAVRIGREIAQRHIRHLETVAINCDPKVQGFEDYDRRVYLGPETGPDSDTGGSPVVGGVLARAAEPSLQRIFHGAAFVVLIGSLGGGAGSGAFPYVLEVASRNAGVVSAFVIKPFRCEGDRRALADRAIGRLQLLEAFSEKREQNSATLKILDNEDLVPALGHLAFSRVGRHWAALVEEHIEHSILAPAEAILETAQMNRLVESIPAAPLADLELPRPGVLPVPGGPAPELPPVLPAVRAGGSEAELTFEIEVGTRPPTP